MRRSCTSLKLVRSALVMICLMPVSSRAQASHDDRAVGALQGGDWSLQFQIVENFTLTSFDGLMLSIERHWSPRAALRLGVDLGLGTSNGDSRTDSADSLASNASSWERSEDYESVSLKMQYVSYSNPEGRLHFYWAAGPRLSFSRSHAERVSESVTPSRSTKAIDTDEAHSWETALAGSLGIQWFAARGLGLLAEYVASAGYEFGKETGVRTYEATGVPAGRSVSESKQHDFKFDSLGVRFGVSVFF